MTSREYQSHHMTLLDGEMVVDEDRESGKHMYRYLAYDIMALNSEPLVHKPWKVSTLPDTPYPNDYTLITSGRSMPCGLRTGVFLEGTAVMRGPLHD